jgi:hypothetical protein
MKNEPFPIVGLCQVCNNGTDATAGLTAADAVARTTRKKLLPLVRYKNMLVCERCKKNEERKDESRSISRRSIANERFIRGIGVKVNYE